MWMFWVGVILLIVAPPVGIVVLAYYLWFKEPNDEEKKNVDYLVKRPCPRCANAFVVLYGQGSWDYFTCGMCGARGWYPFKTREQLDMRLKTM